MSSSLDALELLERVGRVLLNDEHAQDLKPTQWAALRFLARANRFSRSPGALTRYLGSTKGTVSQTLLSLERRGLIQKDQNTADRRVVRLSLTTEGQARLESDPIVRMEKAISALPEKTREDLGGGLDALLKIRLAQSEGRMFGVCRTCRHFQRNAPQGAPYFCALLEEPLSKNDALQICHEQTA